MGKKVVIIGGVAAGMKTASRLRRRDKDAEIIVLERGSEVSYGACGFPYYISGDVKNFCCFTDSAQGIRDAAFFREVKGVEVLVRHEATAINRDEHTVTYLNRDTGETKVLPYDKLVLATGSTPVKLPIPGADLAGVHNFWFPWDVRAVQKDMTENKVTDVVIVGAGLVGMELAEAFHKQGLTVSVVEMQDRILPQMLDKEIADLIQKPVLQAGINLYLNEKTMAIEGTDKVTAVKTDKRAISAQMVIVAVGVRPNVELAREAGIVIGPSGSIAVNEYLETSDPDIYAGGDCAENTNLISKAKLFTPMGSTANKHGRVIADNIAGEKIKYPGILNTGICQVLNWQAGSTGLNETTAKKAGVEFETVVVPGFDRLGYMPGANRLILKLMAEVNTHRVIGAQAVGTGGVDKRIDAIATAMTFGAKVEDLSNIDYGYAPPFNGPIDNVSTAANVLMNKLAGRLRSINPKDFQKIKGDPSYTLVDVRTPGEYAANRIAGCANIVNLALGSLRSEAEKVFTDKKARLVCSCQIDLRGYEAETIMRSMGYENVQSLEGGMSGWPYETEGANPQ
jgi:NADPH-dependent 2,4-dienoyl-CoA reductase/sulfur reductase-like enzyme/rhodanese-related sulfurtransferase